MAGAIGFGLDLHFNSGTADASPVSAFRRTAVEISTLDNRLSGVPKCYASCGRRQRVDFRRMRFVAAAVEGDRASGGRAFKCSIGVPIKVSNTDLCASFYRFATHTQVGKHITFERRFWTVEQRAHAIN
ncbi:hypothetical protein HYPDE_36868 [Hyphomicrobium denitrificans 1NES1]|uniref:Uncharacterized protein n=1 Tax=Hyphomicrobium denitrificans 1NES1 TaxID=670307 RepID=N0BG26_9HYPH|nr:hypothetical protein HYPDE_36868 [Hyphomicrobium denitrificans 1NES1]